MKSSIGAGLRNDRVAGAGLTIDYTHHEIHEGDAFVTSYLAESKNDGQTIAISFLTGAKYLHIFWVASSSGAAFFRIYENPTITDNSGSPQTVFNHNRNSLTVSTVIDRSQNPDVAGQATKDPAITGAGTLLFEEPIGGANRSGGESRNDEEIVLKPNEEYVFIVESNGSGLTLGIVLSWYEKTGN